jgi:hypothetical protein
MFSAGQNLVNGQTLRVCPATGSACSAYVLTHNVANSESQRTILIGDTATAGSPDFVFPSLANDLNSFAAGGAVCWATFDCVSWGNYTGTGNTSPTGTPTGQLLTSQVAARNITRGCATALDPADDTNDSATDFGLAVGFPTRNNAGAVTETPCPTPTPTPITPAKAKKCKKKKAKKKGAGGPAYAAKKKKCKKKKK